MKSSIVLLGGSGLVGRQAAQTLRRAHPDVPLVIAGRDGQRAEQTAAEIGDAVGVALDPAADDLGLGERPVSAVAALYNDPALRGLAYAQSQGAAYLSISANVSELGPEVAAFMHRPQASAIVLGAEWLVGATSVPALWFAREFGRVDSVRVGALLDDTDPAGPSADADIERQSTVTGAALTREDGAWTWTAADAAETTVHTLDGREVTGVDFSSNDVLVLATGTGAPDVSFGLAVGETSSRRRGDGPSTEIVTDLRGVDHSGRALHTCHAVTHPDGQIPLTGLGVAMVLERLAGLTEAGAPAPGLYFPTQLLDPERYLSRLAEAGGVVTQVDVGASGV